MHGNTTVKPIRKPYIAGTVGALQWTWFTVECIQARSDAARYAGRS